MRQISTFLFILLFGQLLASEWQTDLKKIQDKYNSINEYTASITYNLYSEDQLIESTKSSTEYKDGNYVIKMGDVEIYNTPKFNLTVRNDEKVLILLPPRTSHQLLEIDSLVPIVSKGTISSLKDNYKTIRLEFDQGDFTFMEIEYNPTTFMIRKIRQKQRYETEYAKGKFGKVLLELNYQKMTFSTSSIDFVSQAKKYIIQTKSTWKTQPNYKNYQLINLVNNE